ncbi:hypothetical protein [Mucilaginibacter aquatilis]|uniref:Uncharacterized protein n=1 Tax=Mucilaginibacter aquatilis TaxID=1517760 RepID=A0A6I4I8F8_9SPHI|nr:hypothetical protein [Mucilaginibacter aquatilis]MVN90288.1 hypothetical protein [Mucilaginibacter aquatilis]
MQHDTTHPNQLLKQVLSSPVTLSEEHISNLQTLLYSFPQCGALYAIQARSGSAQHLNAAAARFSNSSILQKIVQQPQLLATVSPSQIIYKTRKVKEQAQPSEVVEQAGNTVLNPAVETPQVIPAVKVTVEEVKINAEEVYEAYEEPVHPISEPIEEAADLKVTVAEEVTDSAVTHGPLPETQKLIIENIATTDYFVFDRAFVERDEQSPAAVQPDDVSPQEPAPVHQADVPPVTEEKKVTRYHDDKMPYSFMWWLDKTRNKHSGIYQPFAAPSSHLTDRQPPLPIPVESVPHEVLDTRKKEEELVDRFIQEDPQIKPPSSDKLDNENKARQSAEDQEELITETLARIYADQMLYSKAIAAYKILMLKNPEKRRYFASQIEILEKKIN